MRSSDKKTKLLVIVSSLLGISLFVNVWWMFLGQGSLSHIINEYNRGAEIDTAYVNKVDDTSQKLYDIWNACNVTLSKEFQGNLSDSEIDEFIQGYIGKTDAYEKAQEETMEMKAERSAEFLKFKYARIYRP